MSGRILKTVDSVYQDVSNIDECRELCLNSPYRYRLNDILLLLLLPLLLLFLRMEFKIISYFNFVKHLKMNQRFSWMNQPSTFNKLAHQFSFWKWVNEKNNKNEHEKKIEWFFDGDGDGRATMIWTNEMRKIFYNKFKRCILYKWSN